MYYSVDDFVKLQRILMPTGRAFRIVRDGNKERFHYAMNSERFSVYNQLVNILNGLIPDNDDFVESDCERWEIAFGIIPRDGTSLEDRKAAILQCMQYPGDSKYRGSAEFMEYQLQLAGFQVRVFENKFSNGDGTFSTRPTSYYYPSTGSVQHGIFQHGQINHGGLQAEIIANHDDPEKEIGFDVGATLFHTFFITGMGGLGTYASIPVERRQEFRRLVLKLKFAHLVGYSFVNYT